MIEETLSELTGAIRALTAAILTAGGQPSPTGSAPAPATDTPAPARVGRPRRTKAEMEADAAKAAAAATKPEPEPAAEPEQEEVAGDYDEGTSAEPAAADDMDDLFDTTPSEPEPAAATLDDARGVVMRVAQCVGREAGAKLVAEFGAAKLGDVKPADFGKLVARGEAILAEWKAARAAA